MLGRSRVWVVVLMMTVSLWGWAGEAGNPQLTVFVIERAGTPARVLTGAERNAAQVFRQAGVDVGWVNCDERKSEAACEKISHADLIVHMIPRARTLSGEVFGVAFVENSAGVYADVFVDPIQRLHEQDRTVSLSPILGDVLAHEIGHLLLRSNAHSREGIMQAHWQAEQLHRVAKGQMRFTKEQAIKMRTRVSSLHNDQRDESTLVAMRD